MPELADRAIGDVARPLELVSLQDMRATLAHECVAIERWCAPAEGPAKFLGFRDGEVDLRLTAAIAGAQVERKRRRLIVGGVAG